MADMTRADRAPLQEAEIRELVSTWYRVLTDPGPADELVSMLTPAGPEMWFPEATLRGVDEFRDWYAGVQRTYFDQVHRVKRCAIAMHDDGADLDVVVHWEASTWTPPAAYSERTVADAYQTWRVARSALTGNPVIVTYNVDSMKPCEQS